jgi:hypothetical protein
MTDPDMDLKCRQSIDNTVVSPKILEKTPHHRNLINLNILFIEVYVDDILFGSNDDKLSQKFAKDMQNEFEMSLLGELSFFLGLQICQINQGIFISQTKYIR